MNCVVVDTHILFWYLSQPTKLSISVNKVLDGVEEQRIDVVFPTLVLVELLGLLERKGKAKWFDPYFNRLEKMPHVLFLPLTPEVVRAMSKISRALSLHDRIILASAQVMGGTLLTQDQEIIASGIVPTLS